MKQSYLDCLYKAYDLSKELNLISTDLYYKNEQLKKYDELPDCISKLQHELKANPFVLANCFILSHWLKKKIDDFFGENCAIITLGHVIHNDYKEFYEPVEERLRLLEVGNVRLPIKFHCWITLPGGFILDPTYLTTKYTGSNGKILFAHYEDIPREFFFYPEFIGSEYLLKVGIPTE